MSDERRSIRMTRTTSRSDVLAAPLLERFVEPLREAVVDHRREVLLVDAVVPVGQQQFLGADQAERIEQLRADRVVAAFAAVERQQETRAPCRGSTSPARRRARRPDAPWCASRSPSSAA